MEAEQVIIILETSSKIWLKRIYLSIHTTISSGLLLELIRSILTFLIVKSETIV